MGLGVVECDVCALGRYSRRIGQRLAYFRADGFGLSVGHGADALDLYETGGLISPSEGHHGLRNPTGHHVALGLSEKCSELFAEFTENAALNFPSWRVTGSDLEQWHECSLARRA